MKLLPPLINATPHYTYHNYYHLLEIGACLCLQSPASLSHMYGSLHCQTGRAVVPGANVWRRPLALVLAIGTNARNTTMKLSTYPEDHENFNDTSIHHCHFEL